jgi:hypothetical protein
MLPRSSSAALVAWSGAALLAPALLLAFQEGPLPAHTGGFGEPSCHLCHFDNPVNDPGGTLDLTGVPDRYTPGEAYPLTVHLARPGARRAGFQLSVRFAAGPTRGRQAGRLEPAAGGLQIVTAADTGVDYLTHDESGSRPDPSGAALWRLRWVAPPAPAGPVLFHVAANGGNDDQSPLGDYIYTVERSSSPR